MDSYNRRGLLLCAFIVACLLGQRGVTQAYSQTRLNGTACMDPTIAVAGGAGAVGLRYGESELVNGRLSCAGPPPYEAQIEVTSFTGAGEAIGAPTFVDVAADGSFHSLVPSGPNRELIFSYAPVFGERPAALSTLEVNVTPRIVLSISPRRTHNYGTVRWRGAIEGGPYPSSGILLLPEVKEGRHWTVFGQILARGGGAFAYEYTFLRTHRPTTYTFRIATPVTGAAGYDYLAGASEPIEVRVR